jgi:cysteine dioxygenase
MTVSGLRFPVQIFVTELREIRPKMFTRVADVRQFLLEHPVNPTTLGPYLYWDVEHYTRNPIDKTPFYELLAICWEVGQGSAVHNHRGQNCWMAVPIGRLLVQNYRVLHQNVSTQSCDIAKSDIVEMNATNSLAVNPEEPVHKVFNPRHFNARAVSLHLLCAAV